MNSKDPGLAPLNGMMLDLRHAALKYLAQGSRVAETVIAVLDASAEHLPAASGEPVAWQLPGTDSIITAKMKAYRGVLAETWAVPLYATAQPAPALVPLTDEQIDAIRGRAECWEHVGQRIEFRYRPFTRAIEAAHGIGTPAKEAP